VPKTANVICPDPGERRFLFVTAQRCAYKLSHLLMQVTNKNILHNESLPSQKKTYIVLTGIALYLIAVLDHATGDVPFQHLYYLPIIVSATEFGFFGGLVVSFASVALYHLANTGVIHTYQLREADVVQSLLFLFVGLVAAKLAQDAKQLRLLSITDDLTGLHNLRSFETRLARLVGQAKRDGSVLSVLVVDVDRLKELNDRYGHHAGAEAVRTVGQIIGNHVPSRAVACRYGGDEYVVAIPHCDDQEVMEVSQNLRHLVASEKPVLANVAFPEATLSVSVGAACRQISKDCDLLAAGEDLFKAADRALYRAKELGRNTVCMAA
jgi:diguanylate cyclase (GGDEF)-like protein